MRSWAARGERANTCQAGRRSPRLERPVEASPTRVLSTADAGNPLHLERVVVVVVGDMGLVLRANVFFGWRVVYTRVVEGEGQPQSVHKVPRVTPRRRHSTHCISSSGCGLPSPPFLFVVGDRRPQHHCRRPPPAPRLYPLHLSLLVCSFKATCSIA